MTATLPGELIYRVVTDFEALHEMLRDRVEDLNISRISLDAAGGFTPGYSAKLLCNPPMRMLSRESLGRMLAATGMVLIGVVDDERFAAIKSTLEPRKRRDKPANAGSVQPTWLFKKNKAREMGKRRFSLMSDMERARHQRKAGKASGIARRRKARMRPVPP